MWMKGAKKHLGNNNINDVQRKYLNRILIISAVFPPEPVVSAMLSSDIAKALSKHKDVVVLCPPPTRPAGFRFFPINDESPYKVIRLKSFTCAPSNFIGRFYESFSFGRHCSKYIYKHRKEINSIYINSWPLLSQFLIIKAARKLSIPTILHIQDIYPESLINKLPFFKKTVFKVLLPLDKFSLRNANHVICISEKMRGILQSTREIPLQKFSVVPNWQNEESFNSFQGVRESNEPDSMKKFTFLYLGNNGPLAGVDFLIKSFVKAAIPNTKFIVAGTGSRTDFCKQLVKELDVHNVEFLPVPQGKVAEVQAMGDVMLLPVKKGGAMSSIPSKLPAYMFSAKPIIGSLDKESDTAQVILEAECGIVVEPENEIEIISAMKRVADWSPEKLKEKGENGFKYAIKHFSRQQKLKKIVDIIDSLSK